MILNATRARLAEFGIIAAQGPRHVVELLARMQSENSSFLPDITRK